jgi:hypothetical protein
MGDSSTTPPSAPTLPTSDDLTPLICAVPWDMMAIRRIRAKFDSFEDAAIVGQRSLLQFLNRNIASTNNETSSSAAPLPQAWDVMRLLKVMFGITFDCHDDNGRSPLSLVAAALQQDGRVHELLVRISILPTFTHTSFHSY